MGEAGTPAGRPEPSAGMWGRLPRSFLSFCCLGVWGWERFSKATAPAKVPVRSSFYFTSAASEGRGLDSETVFSLLFWE